MKLFVAGFEHNTQELEIFLRRKVCFIFQFLSMTKQHVNFQAQNQIIEEQDLKRFAFELTSYHATEVTQLATHYNSRWMNKYKLKFKRHLLLFITSVDVGLTEKVATARLKQHGRNIVEAKRNWPLWAKFIRSFFVWFSPLLWVATALMIISWQVMPLRFVRNYYVIVVVLLLSMILSTSLVVFWRVSTLFWYIHTTSYQFTP